MSQQIERLPKGKAVCLIDADSLLYYEMNRDTLEEAMAGLDQRVHDILHQCNTTKYAGFLTQGKCFRYDVDVEYKAKRKKSNRSILVSVSFNISFNIFNKLFVFTIYFLLYFF